MVIAHRWTQINYHWTLISFQTVFKQIPHQVVYNAQWNLENNNYNNNNLYYKVASSISNVVIICCRVTSDRYLPGC